MATLIFTAPRTGWYRFMPGAEPEYLSEGTVTVLRAEDWATIPAADLPCGGKTEQPA